VPRRPDPTRGFTLIEMAVVVAIVGVLAALAITSLERSKPRANLSSTSQELHALLRNARLNALATGNPTIVAFFPDFANRRGGVGRVLVLEDAAGTFFVSSSPTNFSNFDPAGETGETEVLLRLDLPRGIALASGAEAPPSFGAPYDRVTVGACSFCATGGDARGAIRFDSRGRATFFSTAGAPADAWGASLALSMRARRTTDQLGPGVRLFVITASTGSVKSFARG
jgi:prepilin-type N-terminal cleavage/methylation domain-containing protein